MITRCCQAMGATSLCAVLLVAAWLIMFCLWVGGSKTGWAHGEQISAPVSPRP